MLHCCKYSVCKAVSMKQPVTACMYSKLIEINGKELNNLSLPGGGIVSTEVFKSHLLLPKTRECFKRFYTVFKTSFSSLDFNQILSLKL